MAKKVLYAVGLLIKTVLLCCTAAQQWEATGQPEVSKFGMMLQRHIFKRITGAGLSDVCLRGCYADVRCQSFNYVFTQDICELSNRTKEARPEDYVPNHERFYFKRDYKRVPLGSISELPAETCQEIKMSEGGQAVSGKYWFHSIVPERTVLAPCDMKTEDVDECNSTIPVCDTNAECANTIGSHSCSCKADFTGNGKKCVDVDECANKSHDCDANASCNNTAGSYRCICNSWYQGNGTSCYFRGLNNSVILTSLDYTNYTGKLLSYLEPVLLSSEWSRFVKCWHAKTEGWAASTFHSNCDGRGPTVTIIKANDSIFGGYTDVSWGLSGSCRCSYARKAFLFSLNNIKGYNPVKLTQYRYQHDAMCSCSRYGPIFGWGRDIIIYNDAVNNQGSYTECGGTYKNPTGYSSGDCKFFTGAFRFTPSDIEVFFEIGGFGASTILGGLDPNEYLGKMISFLDPVLPSASRTDFIKCWHAKTDGWAASKFHSKCDGRGPTVTIIKMNDSIFGGYTDVSWSGGRHIKFFKKGYSYASKAFIFSLYNVKGYNPVKLTQYRYQQYAMYRCNTYGPTFGGHDIYISDGSGNNQNSYTRCGSTYTTPSGYSYGNCGFFTGGSHFSPTDVEVFYEAGLGLSAILRSLDYNQYLKVLFSYLDPVLINKERSRFVRCWHAKTDGWAASTFHSNCDGRGPTVTIIKVNSYIFGGYTDVSWTSGSCAYSSASKAFVFSLYNVKGYNPVKLTQYRYQQYAMYRCSSRGPTFGWAHDIYLHDDAVNNQHCYTRCGGTYSNPTGYSAGDCKFFTGASNFTPSDIEVFFEITN
ncbi:unnamed protein product [Pocillopora meandrina]|uniref:Uncharacterized protein n=1 Tax=Pocillopora meandrina TaxID=46732 RepID=A0AAU9X3M7_9CNID|nr:unnamed protein product [Pocillopora meandrina]